jgi:hypothetical protein
MKGALGWLALLTVGGACAFEVDEDLCLDDDHCGKGEVCTLANACLRCSGEACPAHERCETDEDCASNEACASDNMCRMRCVVDAQCTKSGRCKQPVCAAPMGEPCVSYNTPCAGDECSDTDNRLRPVPAYCSMRCLPGPCPEGYECVESVCRKIVGGAVCNYPNPTGYCAACLWENCYNDLDTCCQGQICQDIYSQIALCDADQTYSSCLPFASSANFAATSEELRSCLEIFCNEGECLPPPM